MGAESIAHPAGWSDEARSNATVGSTRCAVDNPRVHDDETDDETDGEAPVEIPITDTLDLHPFLPSEIPEVARDFLVEAHARGYRQVRLIHGRGIGVQRERIRSLLQTLELVAAFHDADGSGGGWGATVVLLKD